MQESLIQLVRIVPSVVQQKLHAMFSMHKTMLCQTLLSSQGGNVADCYKELADKCLVWSYSVKTKGPTVDEILTTDYLT